MDHCFVNHGDNYKVSVLVVEDWDEDVPNVFPYVAVSIDEGNLIIKVKAGKISSKSNPNASTFP